MKNLSNMIGGHARIAMKYGIYSGRIHGVRAKTNQGIFKLSELNFLPLNIKIKHLITLSALFKVVTNLIT